MWINTCSLSKHGFQMDENGIVYWLPDIMPGLDNGVRWALLEVGNIAQESSLAIITYATP